MKEHIKDILVGGRPMTKLERANKEIERLNNIINDLEKKLKIIIKELEQNEHMGARERVKAYTLVLCMIEERKQKE